MSEELGKELTNKPQRYINKRRVPCKEENAFDEAPFSRPDMGHLGRMSANAPLQAAEEMPNLELEGIKVVTDLLASQLCANLHESVDLVAHQQS